MPEWIHNYGQLLGVVVGGIIAGSVAIIVGARNNRANDRRLNRQFESERLRDSSKVRRDRLEELHVLIGQWLIGLDTYTMLGLQLASGAMSYRDYLAKQVEFGNASGVQLTRMRMLLDIYGTIEIKSAYLVVDTARADYNKAIRLVDRAARGREVPRRAEPEIYQGVDDASGRLHENGKLLLAAIAEAAARI